MFVHIKTNVPVRTVSAVLALLVLAAPASAAWWDANWGERLKLTFDNSARVETLVDFPVLVTLTPARVDYGKIQLQGEDIRFIDGNTGAVLRYEIETWVDGSTSRIWVKVPQILGFSQVDHIWLYYDNPAAVYEQTLADEQDVWSNSYRAVWHLRETDIDGGADDIRDSTSFGNHGTTNNMDAAAQVAGQVNGSFDFDGVDDYVDVVDDDSLSFTDNINDSPFSLSFWVSSDASIQDSLAGKSFETTGQEKREWAIRISPGGLLRFVLYDNDSLTDFIGKDSGTTLPAGWHHVLATYDGSGASAGMKIYVDGVRDDATTIESGSYSSMKNTDATVMLGARFSGAPGNLSYLLDGKEDEVRISAAERSADWGAAQYLSTTDAFITYGSMVVPCAAPIPKLYWTDSVDDKIRRANLDGSAAEDLLTSGVPKTRDIAIDSLGCKMYWTDALANKIQRANLDGSGLEDLIAGLDRPAGLALDLGVGKMYWANDTLNKIQTANLDGTGIEDVILGLTSPYGIALDGPASKIYWADDGTDTIEHANVNGTGREVLFSGADDPGQIALDLVADKMYWIEDGVADLVRRADLDGGNVETLITGTPEPYGIALHLPPRPTLSSASDEEFGLGSPPRPAAPITIAEDRLITTITAVNDLRIRIPSGFNMEWDTSVTTVILGGSAAANLSATVLGYEDTNKTVVLDVTADLSGGDVVTVSGLGFFNFTALSPADNLELDIDDDGTGDALDDKTVTISTFVITTTGAATVDEGQIYTLNLSASGPVTSWTLNWGDGSIETIAGNPSSVTHTYTGAGFTFNILASAVSGGTTYLQNDLVVPSNSTDSLMWYDNARNFLRETGPDAGLDAPIEAILGPDGNVYVSGSNSGNVVRYDGATGAFVDEFAAGRPAAAGMAFGPDGNLYVADWSTHEVVRFDGSTGAFLDVFVTSGLGGLIDPVGLIFGPDGNLYVGSYDGKAVFRYNGNTGAFIDVFVTSGLGGLKNTEDLTFGPDGNLYVASEGTHEVLRYDGTNGAFIDAFVTAGLGGLASPNGLAFGPDGHLYVGSWDSDEVLRYNGATGALIDDYVTTGLGGLNGPSYFDFIPGQQVTVTAVVVGPTLSSAFNQVFDVADPPTPAATITITDNATLPRIKAANDLRIRIPPTFNMTWDTSVTGVIRGGVVSSKVAATVLGYEDADRTAVIDVTTDFAAGDVLTLSGLRFTNFTAPSAADFLSLEVDNDGVATATDNKLIIIVNSAPLLHSDANQVFGVGAPSTPAVTLTITDSGVTPSITKKNELRLRIPSGFNMVWDTSITTITVGGPASSKLATTLRAYEDANQTAVIDVVTDFVAGEQVTIDGLSLTSFTAVSAADNLELEVLDDNTVAATDDQTIEIDAAAPILSSAANQVFGVGDPATAAATITVLENPTSPTITAKRDIRIRIPSGFNMTWDPSITSVTLGGSAAPDVSTSLLDYEDAGRTAVLNVTTDFTVAATLTVSGLSFDNFTSVSAAANLELEVLNDGGLSATDDKTKVIVADAVARIVSEMDQLFFEGDPPTPASPIHVTDASTASITAGNDLRIRIPAALDMLWDISVTSVGVSGSAASKVDATVAYEDSGKTLVLNVTTDFAASDHVRLSGLSFTAFIESPPGNLELEVLNDDAVTSTDPRSVTIDPKSKVRVFTAKSTSTENRLEWLNPKSGPYVQTWIVARDDGSFPTGPFDGRFVVSQAGGGLERRTGSSTPAFWMGPRCSTPLMWIKAALPSRSPHSRRVGRSTTFRARSNGLTARTQRRWRLQESDSLEAWPQSMRSRTTRCCTRCMAVPLEETGRRRGNPFSSGSRRRRARRWLPSR